MDSTWNDSFFYPRGVLKFKLNMQKATRLKRELDILAKNPPPGISCAFKDDSSSLLDASIVGLEGTPYEYGVFKLEIQIPEKYPFEPPLVKFLTPVYHPNIDSGGRICLDLLKVGKWKATITLSYLLMSIRLLLAEPNPNDPLMAEIAEEFQFNRPLFNKTAQKWTLKYACTDLKDASSGVLAENKMQQTTENIVKKRKSSELEDSDKHSCTSKVHKIL